MDSQIIIQYLIVLLSLIVLEGLLSADNAIVLAVMVRHLPPKEQKHALLYGLAGALIFRIIAIFLITILAQYWQIQVLGGLYLLFMAGSHIKEFFDKRKNSKDNAIAILVLLNKDIINKNTKFANNSINIIINI